MSKLQILIPQYNEDENKIKPLLDSIAIQQDINFDDIEVFIGNDGSDTKISVDFLKQYNYRIQYHYFEHEGQTATRKKLFQLVTAPYVMWCDADDKFISTIALSLILQMTKENFDLFIDNFIEQHPMPEGGLAYIPHSDDSIFVHGKVYRADFLRENKIEWHPELTVHEDSAFNVLARTCAKRISRSSIPLYMWCYNKNSIGRKEGLSFIPNTWPQMIDSYQALIEDLKDRGFGSHTCYYSKYCLYATYYEMAHERWNGMEEQKLAAYRRLKEFYNKNELLIKNCNEKDTQELIKATKLVAERKGKLQEMPPFEEWLEAILKIF